MTELELLIDLYKNTERQGPGSLADTLNALRFVEISKQPDLKIADIGCGSGGQTFTLANNLKGQITAIDLFPEFLTELNSKAKELDLQDRIKTIGKSMDDLPFDEEELDIIWAEGAIYNIGFENGIKKWKKHLKKGGYLAASEITWITNSRPKEIEEYWNKEYPEIDTASNKISILEENGYSPVGYFTLPEESWIGNFYQPLEKRFPDFLERNDHSELARMIVEQHRKEIKIYSAFKAYYSYGFYIAKKL